MFRHLFAMNLFIILGSISVGFLFFCWFVWRRLWAREQRDITARFAYDRPDDSPHPAYPDLRNEPIPISVNGTDNECSRTCSFCNKKWQLKSMSDFYVCPHCFVNQNKPCEVDIKPYQEVMEKLRMYGWSSLPITLICICSNFEQPWMSPMAMRRSESVALSLGAKKVVDRNGKYYLTIKNKHKKSICDESHCVNFLRKFDNDEEYRNAFLKFGDK